MHLLSYWLIAVNLIAIVISSLNLLNPLNLCHIFILLMPERTL